jgi:hypothetical protein
MMDASTNARSMPKLLAHPLSIAASCAGSVLLAVLSYRAGLAAIPPGCMRGSMFQVLPAIVSSAAFAAALTAAAGGMFHRLRPEPSLAELVWGEALGVALIHAALFGVWFAVYAAADLPAGCGSPSMAELALVGLCQVAHVGLLVRRAEQVGALYRERAR